MKPEDEREFARKVFSRLESGLDELGPEVTQRLQAVRLQALDRYRESPRAVAGLAWAGSGHGVLGGQDRFTAIRNMAIGTLLLLSAFWAFYHQQVIQPENELVESEIGVLTGELPINAYLDDQFQAWLEQSQQ
jgi:hypothetical protein